MESNEESQYAFNWNNHMNHIRNALLGLLRKSELVDVTLCCEGGRLTAHKMLLSMCSPYFRDVFKENPCSHPIVILKDVQFQVMKDLLQFMYDGEVSVDSDDFDAFLRTAELLQICGLTESSEKEMGVNIEGFKEQRKKRRVNSTTEQEVKKKKEEQVEEVPFTSKSEALTEISNIESCDTTQINIKNEIVDIKRMVEPVDNADKFTIDPLIEQEAALTLDGQTNEFDFKQVRSLLDGKPSVSALHLHRCFSSTAVIDKKTINNSDHETEIDTVHYNCKLCNKSFAHKKSYEQHKNVHAGRTRCPICGKVLCRKYQLRIHLYKQHSIGGLATSVLGTVIKTRTKKVKVLAGSDKVLKCLECGKQYKNPKSLEQHMVMHKGRTKCHICDKVLGRRYELKLHLQNVHGIVNK